jgi:eukaryotic-like serine/threonine-protein kinase
MIGQNIGKYKVLDRVGRGGMGTVFRALDDTLNREVAIKILNAELNDPEVARRFRAEAVTVARLNHPGIATIFELFQHDGQWMMVMEFVRGETLEHMVERLGPLSPQRAADLLMQGLAALSHAHRMGVVHRDLKPANLMITESGAVKIMDFGIARVAGSEHLTSAGFLMGTPAYMAPEQVTGGEIDARTDLYSMGVVFYYLVTARLPFKGDNPIAMATSRVSDRPIPVAQVREGLPAWIEPLLDRVLSKSPDDRFPSADQFREALRRGLAGLPMETLSGLSIPPELVATTPPGTLPLPGTIPPLSMPPPTSPGTSPGTSPNPSARLPLTPTAAAAASKTQPVPGRAAGAKTPPNPIAIALGALVVVLAAVLGVMWFRSPRAAAPTPPADTVASTPTPSTAPPTPTPAEATAAAETPSTTPSPATSPIATPTPATTPNAPRAGSPPPVGSTGSTIPGPPAAGSPGPVPTGSPTASAGPAGRAAAPVPTPRPASPAVDAVPVVFNDVKYIQVQRDKGDDQDARLIFGGGVIQVLSRNKDQAFTSEPYRQLARATYVRAKNPKWDPQLAGPPLTIDLSGLFRNTRHWLVLQSKTTYVILRLEDSNWQQILDTFETRTGLKVDRPPSTDK